MVEHAANVDAFNAALAKGYAATANHKVEVEKPTSPSSKKKKKGKGTKELKAVKELEARKKQPGNPQQKRRRHPWQRRQSVN